MTKQRVGLMGILMLAGAVFAAVPASAETHVSIGIGVGPAYGYYAPPPVAYAPAPYYPQSSYWVNGYYDPYGSWIAGYWAPRVVVTPRYFGHGRAYDRDDYRGHDSRGYSNRGDYRGRGNAFGRRR